MSLFGVAWRTLSSDQRAPLLPIAAYAAVLLVGLGAPAGTAPVVTPDTADVEPWVSWYADQAAAHDGPPLDVLFPLDAGPAAPAWSSVLGLYEGVHAPAPVLRGLHGLAERYLDAQHALDGRPYDAPLRAWLADRVARPIAGVEAPTRATPPVGPAGHAGGGGAHAPGAAGRAAGTVVDTTFTDGLALFGLLLALFGGKK